MQSCTLILMIEREKLLQKGQFSGWSPFFKQVNFFLIINAPVKNNIMLTGFVWKLLLISFYSNFTFIALHRRQGMNCLSVWKLIMILELKQFPTWIRNDLLLIYIYFLFNYGNKKLEKKFENILSFPFS